VQPEPWLRALITNNNKTDFKEIRWIIPVNTKRKRQVSQKAKHFSDNVVAVSVLRGALLPEVSYYLTGQSTLTYRERK
jgi:autonomous glycyl radical cofactor GrcA